MSQEYLTQFGRVSRPAKVFGADWLEAPEYPYQPYVQRKRNTAEYSTPGVGGSNPEALDGHLQIPDSLRVVHSDDVGSERPVTRPWSKGYRPPRKDTEQSDSTSERKLLVSTKVANGASQRGIPDSGTPLSRPKGSGKQTPEIVPTAVKPVRGQHTAEGAATASEAGTAAKETTVSLRSPLWRREAVECLQSDRTEEAKVQAAQATWRAARSEQRSQLPSHKGPASINSVDEWKGFSSFRLVSTDEDDSFSDRYPNDEIPPIPKVLVPNTPEDSGEVMRWQRGNRNALTASGLEPVRPLAREAPSTRQREIGLWDSLKNAMKPVNNWLAEVSEAIIQPTTEKASAQRTQVDPVRPGSQGTEEAVKKSERREREREGQLESEYQVLLARKHVLELEIELRKSAIEAKQSLEKQRKLESMLEKSREEADARRRAYPSTSAGMVEPDGRSGPLRGKLSSSATRKHSYETWKVVSNPKAAELASRAMDGAKSRTKKQSNDSGSSRLSVEYESTERRERREMDRKQRRAVIKAIHLDRPRTYNGEAVYDKYESWMENFRYWGDLHDLQEYGTILAMGMVITGTAKEWYSLNVQGHEKEWTLDNVSEDMFRDLFPENYDSVLRETFEDACQGDDSLKKWHKFLIKLSKRVNFVNEHEIRRRFWKGSATYLQMEWARIGLNPEDADTKVETMLETGLRFERARGYGMAEEKRMSSNYPYEDEASDGGRQNEEENLTSEDPSDGEYLTSKTPSKEGSSTEEEDPTDGEGSSEEGNSGEEEGLTSDDPTDKGTSTEEDLGEEEEITSEASSEEQDLASENASVDERDQMRTKRRCFVCGRQGHIARNCPKRRERTPLRKEDHETSPVYVGSLQFEGRFSTARAPRIHRDLMDVDDEGDKETLSSDSDESKPKKDVKVSDPEGVLDPGLESSSESDDLPEDVMVPKWGCGRHRESVSLATTKSMKEPTARRSCVAPLASESEIPSPTCGLASCDILKYDSKSEGESGLEEPRAVKMSQYKSEREPKEKSAIKNSTMAQQGQSYNGDAENYPIIEGKGYYTPHDSQKSIASDPEGRDGAYGKDTFSGDISEDPTHHVMGRIFPSQSRELIHRNQRAMCLQNVEVGSRRALGMISTDAYPTPAVKQPVEDLGDFRGTMRMEEVSAAGYRRAGDDKQERPGESTSQEDIGSNSTISYYVYDVQHHSNANILENPERIGKKYQDTPIPYTPKPISTVTKSF